MASDRNQLRAGTSHGLALTRRNAARGLGLATLFARTAMAEEAPKRGGILRFGVQDEPTSYDCQENRSYSYLDFAAPHYSTLLKFDTANYPDVIGDLAESWAVSANQLSYSFKLRPGVLFHDGTALTAQDVQASYQRSLHPPPGVISVRQLDLAPIEAIETPDERTVVFHLGWAEQGMLARFASPWNFIYSSAKLAADPLFPRTNILGTGAFVFVEHDRGRIWRGRRWEQYFRPGKPALDGFEALPMGGETLVKALAAGTISAEFHGFDPAEVHELRQALGDRMSLSEAPWLTNILIVFNTQAPPFDDERVRRALSLAIDRWGLSQSLSRTTVMRFVGGLMRPGSPLALSEQELVALPGFSRDITASREEAKTLLAAAGVQNLNLVMIDRDLAYTYGPAGEAAVAAWRSIGVSATLRKLPTEEWQAALEQGHFDAAIDFGGDYYDDPSLQFAKLVSRRLSPSNYSGSSDVELDALFIGQALSTDLQERARIVREFERRALTQACTVPLLWWNRAIVTAADVRGWTITPSSYVGQDLTDVWLAS